MKMVLVMLIMTSVALSQFPVDTVVSVTTNVLKRYHSTCVYLLHSTQKQDMLKNKELTLTKLFLKKGFVMTSIITYQDIFNVTKETKCHPLLILLNTSYIVTLEQIPKVFSLPTVQWLLFEDSGRLLDNIFINTHIPINCQFLVAQHTLLKGVDVSLTEVYHIHPSRPLQKFMVANWTSGSEIIWPKSTLVQRRGDLLGINLRAAFIPFSNFLAGTKYPKDKPIERDGFIYETWDPLQKNLNFTTDFSIPKDGALGAKTKNGSWNGLIEMVASKSSEVIAFLLAMTGTRMEVVDYLMPIVRSKFAVFIRKPDITDHTLKSVLKPFSEYLWLTLLASILGLSFVLTFTWFLDYQQGLQIEVESYNFWNSAFYMTISFFQQGQGTTPQSLPCRLVYITGYILALVMMVAYSAIFISFLTVRKFELPFKDFEGFLENKNYQLGVLEKSATLNIFSSSGNKVLKDIYRQFIFNDKDPPKSLMEGMKRTCAMDKYAFINLKLMAMLHRRYLSCQVVEIPHASFPVPLSMAVNKESPYKIFFDFYFIKMQEAGILQRNGDNIIPLKFREYNEEEPPKSVSLDKVAPIFFIFTIGILLSVPLIFIEKTMHHTRQKINYSCRQGNMAFYN